MIDLFNTREIATGVWIFAFLIWGMTSTNVRKSLLLVVKHMFNRILLLTFLITALYLNGISVLLSKIFTWQPEHTKALVFWGIFAGLSLVFRSVKASRHQFPIRGLVFDQLKFVIVVEFLVNLYSFPLIVELITLPIIAMLAMSAEYSKEKPEYAAGLKVMNGVLTIYTLTLFLFSIGLLIKSNDHGGHELLTGLVLPVVIFIMFLPFLYALITYMNYDLLFARVRHGSEKSQSLIRKIKFAMFRNCGFSLKRLKKVSDINFYNFLMVANENDLEELKNHYRACL